MSASRSVNSSGRDSIAETHGDDDNSVVAIEGNWAFPADDGVLSTRHLHMNPDWPEPDSVDEAHSSAADLCVAIKYKSKDIIDRADNEERYADLFYVGRNRPQQVVHGRKVQPGWYAIMPNEATYSVLVSNWSPKKVSCTIYLDGEKVSWQGLRPDKTAEVPGFELVPAVIQENVNFNDKKFGILEFRFHEVTKVDRVVKDKASAPPRKDAEVEANPSKAVNEKKKNNLTFMSVAKPPKRQREKGKVGDTVNRWDLGEKIIDDAMPKGSLTIHYRTKLWAHAAGWIQDEEDEEAQAQREDDEYRERLRREVENDQPNGRGKKRGASASNESAPKRAKTTSSVSSSSSSNPGLRKASSAPKLEDAMEKLTEEDSLEAFFSTLAPVHERSLDDYKPVIDHLKAMDLKTVGEMIQVSDEAWISTHLPEGMASTAKRALRASITQALIYIQSKKVFVDLTDD